MIELVLRLVFSLAVVIGLLTLIARVAARRFRGRPGAAVSVVHRQQINRHASVTVVTVGSRVLVLGTTEQQVRVLAELDPAELADPAGDVGLELAVDVTGDRTTQPTPDRPMTDPATGPSAVSSLPAARTTVPSWAGRTYGEGPLAGSVLSPATWRRAFAAVTGRAS